MRQRVWSRKTKNWSVSLRKNMILLLMTSRNKKEHSKSRTKSWKPIEIQLSLAKCNKRRRPGLTHSLNQRLDSAMQQRLLLIATLTRSTRLNVKLASSNKRKEKLLIKRQILKMPTARTQFSCRSDSRNLKQRKGYLTMRSPSWKRLSKRIQPQTLSQSTTD